MKTLGLAFFRGACGMGFFVAWGLVSFSVRSRRRRIRPCLTLLFASVLLCTLADDVDPLDSLVGVVFGAGRAGGRSGGVIPSTDIAEGSFTAGRLGFCPNLAMSPPRGLSLATCVNVRTLVWALPSVASRTRLAPG